MSRRLPIHDAVSAGGVVWRRTDAGEVEVVLCGRSADRLWCLPKGTPDGDETMEQTAEREVREETGLLVERGERLGTIEYWFTDSGIRYHKFVHHWLMRPIGGNTANHDHEFDDVQWVPGERARRMLKYGDEKGILDEALRRIEEVA
ncbi:MAG: NUDIX hydrolase [Tepidiformaceae bacterium]